MNTVVVCERESDRRASLVIGDLLTIINGFEQEVRTQYSSKGRCYDPTSFIKFKPLRIDSTKTGFCHAAV